jgi:hypothetical protein
MKESVPLSSRRVPGRRCAPPAWEEPAPPERKRGGDVGRNARSRIVSLVAEYLIPMSFPVEPLAVHDRSQDLPRAEPARRAPRLPFALHAGVGSAGRRGSPRAIRRQRPVRGAVPGVALALRPPIRPRVLLPLGPWCDGVIGGRLGRARFSVRPFSAVCTKPGTPRPDDLSNGEFRRSRPRWLPAWTAFSRSPQGSTGKRIRANAQDPAAFA